MCLALTMVSVLWLSVTLIDKVNLLLIFLGLKSVFALPFYSYYSYYLFIYL